MLITFSKAKKIIVMAVCLLLFSVISFAQPGFNDNLDFNKLIFSTPDGIFKISNESLQAEKISDDKIYYTTLIENNGFVYYATDESFKRINLDGKEEKIYTKVDIFPDIDFKYFYNNYFYFPNGVSEAYNYYALKLDGTIFKKIFDGLVLDAFFENDKLYIIGNLENEGIYRYNNSGEKEKVYNYKGEYLYSDGEWFYFRNYNIEFNSKLFSEVKINKIPYLYRVNKNFNIIESIPTSTNNITGYLDKFKKIDDRI